MYIHTIKIRNVRAISQFDMKFSRFAGWHVVIGDNGAGKSSVIRSIALALIGPEQAYGLRANWDEWLNVTAKNGSIALHIEPDYTLDKFTGKGTSVKKYYIPDIISFNRKDSAVILSSNKASSETNPMRANWGEGKGWFSAAYGPFRRFGGGNPEWTKVFFSQPKLGAHLSAFGEDVALTEATEWLIKLQYQALERKQAHGIIDDLKVLINSPDFLPRNVILESISSEGVIFKDANGVVVSVTQLSDGFRSILSLTFELIRQLDRVYGTMLVFQQIRQGNPVIDLPGVVLIDEIDAHLHPNWQTKIGGWFIKYFPRIQFIVTTHSPLICRASEKGTIWRLGAPGSDQSSGEVNGSEKERLLYGNILDAYGTELFGNSPARSTESKEKLSRLGRLNMLSAIGKISDKEEEERIHLQRIFTTDAPTS